MPGSWSPSGPLVKGRPLGLAEDEVGGPSGSAVEATTAHHLEIKYIEKF